MSKIVQLFLVIFCVTLIQVTEGRARFFSLFNNDKCRGKTDGFYCGDCENLLACEGEVAAEMSCKANDGTKPYCIENKPGEATCTAVKTCLTTTTSKAPKCERAGRFPDPMKCEVYWECAKVEKDKDAQQYSCPPDTRFDAKKEICIKPSGTPLPACITYVGTQPNGLCKGKPLARIPYPTRPDLYARCDGYLQLKMCGINEIYDEKASKCIFTCQTEGFFKNADGKGFITCVKDGTKMISYEQLCKGGEFDESLGYCVADATTTTNSPVTTSSTASTG